MSRAMIAMSGGVDSSVSAVLMQEMGYECVGATMTLFTAEDSEGKCGSEDNARDAASVAERLHMEHYVYPMEDVFAEKVIEPFVSIYEAGATPNPCIRCNRYLKFGALLEKAKELHCHKLVTGHYARTEQREDGRFLLRKARNTAKDQTYVLYFLSQEQLSHICFPLGDFESKDQIRAIAEEHGFVSAHKKESQDICFVPDGDYVGFIERHTGRTYPCGNYCDMQGNVIGQHKGVISYTIGQRKGLGIALGKPAYVCGKCAETNTVYLGGNEDLFSREVIAENVNLIPFDRIDGEMRLYAKIRYNQKEQPATVTQLEDGRIRVLFDESQRAAAKGQAVVLYDGEYVVGGGTII